MEIKKLKNGNLVLKLEKREVVTENIYHDEMFMSDLSINQINGYQYLVDYNRSLVYDLGSYYCQNPLKELLGTLEKDKRIKLYPENKRKSKDLIEDLENGY